METYYGKVLLFVGLVLTIVIRIPHDKRNATIKVEKSYLDGLEKLLLALVAIGVMLLPLLYIFTPVLGFADYPLSQTAFVLGAAFLAGNLWLFYRSHADLGTNWSKTLELRDDHKLITTGVYKSIRHPMYTAIFLYSIAQSLLLPNWIAGPSALIAFTLMYSFRVDREERMMSERFGTEYAQYSAQTKRLIPFIY